jgi:SMI1 / KNR4 family (SUKH-1)
VSGDVVAEIERAQAADLVDEDGDPIALELDPPVSENEVDALVANLGVPLPREVRVLVERTAGIDGVLDSIDFTGRSLAFEAPEIFPSGLPIAHDGFGNHWVIDVTPNEPDEAPVFFACHDPPVILYQSPNLAHFLRETFRIYMPPHNSLVDNVHEDRLLNVWRDNPGVIDRSVAVESEDAALSEFSEGLDERFSLVDLRAPEIGMGFSWGRYGPETEIRRHGYERLFAYARPEKRPGLLRRLFG